MHQLGASSDRSGKVLPSGEKSDADNIAHPQVLGDFRIVRELGRGGMGEVYKAQHRRMKRVVAIKVLPPNAVDSPDAVRRFEREVEAAAKLEWNEPPQETESDNGDKADAKEESKETEQVEAKAKPAADEKVEAKKDVAAGESKDEPTKTDSK